MTPDFPRSPRQPTVSRKTGGLVTCPCRWESGGARILAGGRDTTDRLHHHFLCRLKLNFIYSRSRSLAQAGQLRLLSATEARGNFGLCRATSSPNQRRQAFTRPLVGSSQLANPNGRKLAALQARRPWGVSMPAHSSTKSPHEAASRSRRMPVLLSDDDWQLPRCPESHAILPRCSQS